MPERTTHAPQISITEPLPLRLAQAGVRSLSAARLEIVPSASGVGVVPDARINAKAAVSEWVVDAAPLLEAGPDLPRKEVRP